MGRSRTPERRKRDRSPAERSRNHDRSKERSHKKSKKKRRSRSPSPIEGAKLGDILRKRASPSQEALRTIEDDLSNANFDINKISPSARKWLEERVEEQILTRIEQLERALNERFVKQKAELEQMLRAQIEAELKADMESIRKQGDEQRARCANMEKELTDKIQKAEEKEKQYAEERLAMLKERSALEQERRALAADKDKLKRSEQQTILNKGGNRAPIKFSLGK